MYLPGIIGFVGTIGLEIIGGGIIGGAIMGGKLALAPGSDFEGCEFLRTSTNPLFLESPPYKIRYMQYMQI